MADRSSFFTSLIDKGELRIDEKGHALLFGEFLLLMPPLVLLKHQEQLKEEVGRDRMAALMADAGAYQVEQAVKRQEDRYNLDEVSKDTILERTFNIFNILGWGRADIDYLDTDAHEFRVIINHPTLPSVYRNRLEKTADKPICHFVRGIIEKDFEVLFGEDLRVEEVSCAAVDGDTCVFEGTPTG